MQILQAGIRGGFLFLAGLALAIGLFFSPPVRSVASQNNSTSNPMHLMNVRFELFVQDLDRSIRFYNGVLGFQVVRKESQYASLRCGNVILGLGPMSKLPKEHYFKQERMQSGRGIGVEIVLESNNVAAAYKQVLATDHPIREPLRNQPWGLTDFRIVDPDGYYLRITSRPS